ncbi:MAG: hypothetical protein NXI10_13855 [bacterium]|nr:hypothetical protein [bacterium]
MKQLLFIAIFFTLPNFLLAQEISEKQKSFVNKFVKAVDANNVRKVYTFLDTKYRNEQRRFLGGDKEQLVNELFSGNEMGGNAFVVIPVTEVVRIEIAEIEENEDGSFVYIFRVRDTEHDILAPLTLQKKGRRFGFVGAVG